MPAIIPSINSETKAQKLRRLLSEADVSNIVTSPPLVGANPWQANTFYPQNWVVSNFSMSYICTQTGSSGATGPSGRGVGQTDSTCVWDYIGPQTAPRVTLASSSPAYLAGGTTLSYNNPLIRHLGCAQPIDNGNGYFYPSVNAGLGGKGNAIYSGAVVGTPIRNGFQQDHFGVQLCTDAAVVVFETNNSGWDVNFWVEQNGTKQLVSPNCFPGTTSFTNFWIVDFSQVTQASSVNGANVAPGSGFVAGAVTLSGGVITAVAVASGGVGYSQSNLPTIIAYGGSMTFSANLIPVVNSQGAIVSITVVYGGLYGSTPTIIAQSGKAKRIITMDTGENARFVACIVGPFDTVWPIPVTDRVRAACFGDSWVEGFTQSNPSRRLGMADAFCHLMGWDDCISSGAGGTGYTTPMVPFSATVTSGPISTGLQTVTLSNFNATNGGTENYPLVVGAFLVFGSEQVQLTAVSSGASTVTATFNFTHPGSTSVIGYLNKNQMATTLTSSAITASASAQSITVTTINTPTGAAGIQNGQVIYVDPLGPHPEMVQLTALSGTTLTGVFTQNHAANCVILGMNTTFNSSFWHRVSDVAWIDSATFSNKAANTGNGTCSAVTINPLRVPGNYTFTATSSSGFSVLNGIGSPLPSLTVGVPYSAGGLSLTITQGSTAYITGDVFYVYIKTSPDIIVIGPAGINDASVSATAAIIQIEVLKMYNSIRAILPAVPIIWFGCQGINASTGIAVEDGVSAAISSLNDSNLYYCPIQRDNPTWLNSNNNKGVYVNPAAGHPTDQGYLYFSQRMTVPVRSIIQSAAWQY